MSLSIIRLAYTMNKAKKLLKHSLNDFSAIIAVFGKCYVIGTSVSYHYILKPKKIQVLQRINNYNILYILCLFFLATYLDSNPV